MREKKIFFGWRLNEKPKLDLSGVSANKLRVDLDRKSHKARVQKLTTREIFSCLALLSFVYEWKQRRFGKNEEISFRDR